MEQLFLGKLTWSALPHQWFTISGTVALTSMILAAVFFVTFKKRWRWLWKNWLTSTDPKRIGVMYILVAGLMLFRGGLDVAMIWAQQAISVGANHGYLDQGHFQQIFTAHGDIMVFFVTMGFLFGLLNLIVPLQIGARDLAFPFLNTLSFWLYCAGAVLINMFFVFGGEFAAAGWLSIAPLAELQYSPGVGVDYWIWSLQISGLGTMLGGINFLATIIKMRAPGMTLLRMPLFTWAALMSSVLIVSIFPILGVTIALLNLDRLFGMHFFTSGFGGNPMMYTNLIWTWGHPEVYVLILPSFGIYSEVVSTFSGKRVAGYKSLVAALLGITFLSFLVWLHHFFTMGAGADVNAFFGIMTMFIAIPTALQAFQWLRTMYKGRIRFKTPMYWFMGFVSTFTFGGMAGILMSDPAADFQVHNSLFLVAHFHTMIIGGALFGIFAGITYWFPKVAGFKLNERLGKYAFWCWLVGFFMSFVPLYILGFMGATRRLDHYDPSTGFQPLFILAAIGGVIIAAGAIFQVIQLIYSFKHRKENLDLSGDPWNGRSLEWATFSPAPFYNFAKIPHVSGRDAFWEMKENQTPELRGKTSDKYEDIELSKNTGTGVYISIFALLFGFAVVWRMVIPAILFLTLAITIVVLRTFDEDSEYVLKGGEVEKLEDERRMVLAS